MSIKCPKCGYKNPDDTLYCGKCSALLKPLEDISVTQTLKISVRELNKGNIIASRYEIIGELGRGGMGRVYKALDKEINEEVALKFLNPVIASDESTVERFRNELKFARKIAHKNVCKMYHLAKAEETLYITMEYVRGKDLKSLINRKGKLAEDEVLSIARQVCEGLVEAHRLGVVHRDLKPQNIMIDEKDNVKIMDFGIARSVEAPGITQTGVMIGTPDYISPEQAEGEAADQRSDIYSFGVILYEMVTGSVPFKGDTAFSVALKHKSKLPQEPRELNPKVSENLNRLILICMEKDRERRYQTASDLLANIQNIVEGIPLGEKKFAAKRKKLVKEKDKIKWKKIFLYGGVLLLLVAWWLIKRAIPESPLIIGQVMQLTSEDGTETHPSLSPEGNLIAYAASGEIYLRRVGAENPVHLTSDISLKADEPAFSPDGRLIAFSARLDGSDVRGSIWVMEVMGAGKRRLTDVGFSPDWSPDGKEIAYATEFPTPYDRPRLSGVSIVDVTSGRTRELDRSGSKIDMMEPAWSPSGKRLAYWALSGGANRDIFTRPADGGEAIPVTEDLFVNWSPVWSRDGRHLFFCSDRSGSPNLWRVRIDEKTGRVSGKPEPLTTPASSVMRVDFAADGSSFAFEASNLQANVYRISFDPGRETVLGKPMAITSGSRVWMDLDVSVEGRLVFRSAMRQEDIYACDADGTSITPLAPDLEKDRWPRWSPDGSRIAFSSTKGKEGYEVHSIRGDGSDLRRHTFFEPTAVHFPLWSPDGRRLAFTEYVNAGGRTYVIDVDGIWPKELEPLLTPPEPLDLRYRPWSWSQDGRRIVAYSQRGAGIIVYDVGTGAHERISDLGERPRWLSDSRRVVYINNGVLYLIDTRTKKSREIYQPPAGTITEMCVSHDDQAIYFILRRDEGNIWLATLK